MAIFAYAEMLSVHPHSPNKMRLGFYRTQKLAQTKVIVRSVSSNMLVFEGDLDLWLGDQIEVRLRHAGSTAAHITAVDSNVFTCLFSAPLAYATLSAAPLRDLAVSCEKAERPLEGRTRDLETLGERLVRLRKSKGLTQANIAERLAITVTSISFWERDIARPKAGRLESLSELLDIPIADLLGHGKSIASSEPESLSELMERVREEVAQATGVDSSKVRIHIER